MTRHTLALRQILRATSVAIFLAPTLPTAASAGLLSCFFGGCNYGGGSTGGGSSTPEAAETGVIHVVFIVGDSFFPKEIHAQAGDEIKFYNLTYGSTKVRATDWSWSSDYLDRNQEYSFILQEDTTTSFQKSSYYTQMIGNITIGATPASVDFGDLIDSEGNIVGKDGVAEVTADGLGYTLAALGGTARDVGHGLAKGLTSVLGGGNN